ncbi:MAG TPA: FtsX-like permease family protein [Chloroflexota bacterium]
MRPGFWLSYQSRSLMRGGKRALFAAICIAVGVAGVVALQTASLSIQNALTSNVRAANGGDISLTTDASPLSSTDLNVFKRLKRSGRITSWTAIYTDHATAVSSKHELVPFDVNVVTAPPYPLGGQPTFVSPANGNVARLLRHRGDVLVTSVLAQELNVGVGSRLTVNGLGGQGLNVTVRGILSETNFEHSSAMTVEQRDARTISTQAPQYTAVFANMSGSPTAVAAALRTAFPTATVQTVAEALQADEQQVHDFNQFMLLVGLLALLIAGIGTLNAMQSMLARRRLEIAMLKTFGFGAGALYVLFGGEAVMIGFIGGVIGTAAGAGASKVVSDALARAEALQIVYVLDTRTLIAGVALGVGAALVFAVLPVVQAAGIRPIEILREGSPASARGWFQTLFLLAVVLLLFAALAAYILGDTLLAVELTAGAFVICGVLTGGFSLVIGWLGKLGRPVNRAVGTVVLVALLATTIVAWVKIPSIAPIIALVTVLWAATFLLPRGGLLALLIAARSLSRRRTRTSVTLVAFLAGVLAMALTLTVALSLQSQINQVLAASGSTNLVAITGATTQSAVTRASQHLQGVKQSQTVTVISTRPTRINGEPLASVIGPAPAGAAGEWDEERGRLLGGVTGYDLQNGQGPANISVELGRPLGPQDAGTNHVLVRSSLLGYPFNLQLGDSVTLHEPGSNTARTVRIVGFYHRSVRVRNFGTFFTPPVIGDAALARSLGGSDAQTVVSFTVDPKHLSQDATSLQRAVPGALVINVGDLKAIVETILNELLNLLGIITALVLGAGLAVVANGVALAMLERRREIALFKAIGFSPASVLRFVLVENAFLGTLAGAVSVLATAIALGLLSHYALQQAIGFDPTVAILVLLVASLLAMITAFLAARAPVSVRPIEALRNE